ncbi:hypothetical protein RSgd_1479 [Ralstonia solanacearum]
MTMHICINCKHHRKEGRLGIRCHAGVITWPVRNRVTGTVDTIRQGTPEECYRKRTADTCPDYKEQA